MGKDRYNFKKPVKGNGTPWPDTRDYEGLLCSEWRRVNQQGRIHFAKKTFRHENMIDYIGFWVFVERSDFTGDTITIHPHGMSESTGRFQCVSDEAKELAGMRKDLF